MHLRPGTKEDLDDICLLIEKAVERMTDHGIYQWDELYPTRKDFSYDIDSNTLYTAIEDDMIVAICVISRECEEEYHMCRWDNPDESSCVLHRFCVSPDHQNRGIGSLVLSLIEEQALSMGYTSVRLDVFSGNRYALKLYEKNGYEKRGHAIWRKGLFFIMEKTLSPQTRSGADREKVHVCAY